MHRCALIQEIYRKDPIADVGHFGFEWIPKLVEGLKKFGETTNPLRSWFSSALTAKTVEEGKRQAERQKRETEKKRKLPTNSSDIPEVSKIDMPSVRHICRRNICHLSAYYFMKTTH